MLVIGADQVAVLEREILSKPCYHERAVVQFIRASGKAVIFYTGLYLIDSGSCRCQVDVVPFWVVFRSLTHLQIEHYGGRKPSFLSSLVPVRAGRTCRSSIMGGGNSLTSALVVSSRKTWGLCCSNA